MFFTSWYVAGVICGILSWMLTHAALQLHAPKSWKTVKDGRVREKHLNDSELDFLLEGDELEAAFRELEAEVERRERGAEDAEPRGRGRQASLTTGQLRKSAEWTKQNYRVQSYTQYRERSRDTDGEDLTLEEVAKVFGDWAGGVMKQATCRHVAAVEINDPRYSPRYSDFYCPLCRKRLPWDEYRRAKGMI